MRSPSDVIRPSVRGIKWNEKKKKKVNKNLRGEQRTNSVDEPRHVPVAGRPLTCRVHVVCLQLQDKVRWRHVETRSGERSHVEIESDPGGRRCSLLIKSAALFPCGGRW